MVHDNDVSYYRRREEAAQALASRSSDHHIARIHRDMADRYAARVERLSQVVDRSAVD